MQLLLLFIFDLIRYRRGSDFESLPHMHHYTKRVTPLSKGKWLGIIKIILAFKKNSIKNIWLEKLELVWKHPKEAYIDSGSNHDLRGKSRGTMGMRITFLHRTI